MNKIVALFQCLSYQKLKRWNILLMGNLGRVSPPRPPAPRFVRNLNSLILNWEHFLLLMRSAKTGRVQTRAVVLILGIWFIQTHQKGQTKQEGKGPVGRSVGLLSAWQQPACHLLPRGNRPSNGKVVPHLHNHYSGDRKSFWETINVVLKNLRKKKTEKKAWGVLKKI